MAIAFSNLAAALTTSNGSSVGTVAVPNNGVCYIVVSASFVSESFNRSLTVGGTLNVGGWTEIAEIEDWGSRRSTWVVRGVNTSGSEQSGTITLTVYDPNTGYQEHICHVDLVTGADTTTPNGTVATNSANGATSATVTVSGTPDAGDAVYAAFTHTGASSDMTINGELSNEIAETGGGGNVRRVLTAYDSTPDSSPVPGVSWSGAEDWSGVAFIINAGAGGPTIAPLASRYFSMMRTA